MKVRSVAVLSAVIILVIGVLGASSAHAFANDAERVQAAIDYLEDPLNQNGDGSFGDVTKTGIRDTSITDGFKQQPVKIDFR